MIVPIRLAALAAAVLALAGCGSSGSDQDPTLDVSAATSLRGALADDQPPFDGATVRVATGGSDQLAAQIRAGAKPDVFAAANAKLPDALYAEHLVDKPVAFARNELILAVPGSGARVSSVADLGRRGIRIATGAPSVPVGSYTQTVLGRLPPALRARVARNIRSQEPDVAGVVGKLTQGAVDAGFVYRTDALAAGDKIRAIRLPAALQPQVVYEAAVVRGTDEPQLAERYVQDLVSGPAAAALRRAGFLPPP